MKKLLKFLLYIVIIAFVGVIIYAFSIYEHDTESTSSNNVVTNSVAKNNEIKSKVLLLDKKVSKALLELLNHLTKLIKNLVIGTIILRSIKRHNRPKKPIFLFIITLLCLT